MRSCFGSFSLLFDKWIYMDRWMDRWVDGYICVKVRKNVQVEDNSAPSMGTTKQIKTNESMLKLILLMVRLSPFMLYPNFLYRLLFNHIWSTNALSHLISSTWESNVLVSNFCLDNRHAYRSLWTTRILWNGSSTLRWYTQYSGDWKSLPYEGLFIIIVTSESIETKWSLIFIERFITSLHHTNEWVFFHTN